MLALQRNKCNCHPETCPHFKYQVVDESGFILFSSDEMWRIKQYMNKGTNDN